MRYPNLVEYVWWLVDAFAEDIVAFPDYWSSEADFQSELYRRMLNAFEPLGQASYYVIDGEEDLPENRKHFCRVGVNHGVRYSADKGLFHPDLVIYREPADLKEQFDDYGWPILFALEIKVAAKSEKDFQKLEKLVSSQNVEYGCWLDITYKRSQPAGLVWDQHPKHGCQVWKATVNVPDYWK